MFDYCEGPPGWPVLAPLFEAAQVLKVAVLKEPENLATACLMFSMYRWSARAFLVSFPNKLRYRHGIVCYFWAMSYKFHIICPGFLDQHNILVLLRKTEYQYSGCCLGVVEINLCQSHHPCRKRWYCWRLLTPDRCLRYPNHLPYSFDSDSRWASSLSKSSFIFCRPIPRSDLVELWGSGKVKSTLVSVLLPGDSSCLTVKTASSALSSPRWFEASHV